MNHRIEVCINRAIRVAVEHRNIMNLCLIVLLRTIFNRKKEQRHNTNTHKDYKKEAEKVFNVVVHDYSIVGF